MKINFKQSEANITFERIAEHLNNYNLVEDIQQLNTLRISSLKPEISENGLDVLFRYYAELQQIDQKVPLEEVKIPFRWYSAFDTNKGKPASSFSPSIEFMSVLFNIGSCYNQMGIASGKHSLEQIKKASVYFQKAVGVFQFISEKFSSTFPDSVSSVMKGLSFLNLALAQECFYDKAVLDKVKPGTLSKIAAQISDYYSSSFDLLSSDKSYSSSQFLILKFKSYQYLALSHYKKSAEVFEKGKYGEEIARLKAADEALKNCIEIKKNPSISSQLLDETKNLVTEIKTKLQSSEKDNDIIYLDIVPQPSSLSLDKVELVKSIPFELDLNNPSWKPRLFSKLLPHEISNWVSTYNQRRKNIVNGQLEMLQSANEEISVFLSELGLPGALVAYENPKGLPESLFEKSKKVTAEGGAQSLVEQIQTLHVLAEECDFCLRQCEKILNEEEEEDNKCRNQFKEKWTRTPSTELNSKLKETLGKHKTLLETSRKSDSVVQEKFEKNIPFIHSLCLSRNELENYIPASSQSTSLASTDTTFKNLKQIFAEMGNLKKSRLDIIKSVLEKLDKDDISNSLLKEYSENKNYEQVIENELKKFPLSVCEESLKKQEPLKNQLKTANSQFCQSKNSHPGVREREIAIQNLENAYDAFFTLQDNFSEGFKFYDEFASILKKFNAQCTDYEFARKTEKNDFLKSVTNELQNLSFNAPPVAYSTHTAHPGNPISNPQTGAWNSSIPLSYNNDTNYYQVNPRPSYTIPLSSVPPTLAQNTSSGVWNPNVPLAYNSNPYSNISSNPVAPSSQNPYRQNLPANMYGQPYPQSQPPNYFYPPNSDNKRS